VTLALAIAEARRTAELGPVVQRIPYMEWMGIEMRVEDGSVRGLMKQSDMLIGNYVHRALHGGTLGALLESTAVFELLYSAQSESLPRIVNITIEYLRSGKDTDTHARAFVEKLGRNVANVRAIAWQADEQKPVAAAHCHFLV